MERKAGVGGGVWLSRLIRMDGGGWCWTEVDRHEGDVREKKQKNARNRARQPQEGEGCDENEDEARRLIKKKQRR